MDIKFPIHPKVHFKLPLRAYCLLQSTIDNKCVAFSFQAHANDVPLKIVTQLLEDFNTLSVLFYYIILYYIGTDHARQLK